MARLHHQVVCVGRRANDPFLAAADAYLARLNRYATATLLRLRDTSPADEARRMLAATPPGAHVVALDETGSQWTTAQLVATLAGWQAERPAAVVYYLGGADGLGEAARRRARRCWALSALTLPHRAALALLAEQLYRAHTVLNGEQYHRP